MFDIVIQAGRDPRGVLGISREVRTGVLGLSNDPVQQRFALNLFVAFLPAAVWASLSSQIKSSSSMLVPSRSRSWLAPCDPAVERRYNAAARHRHTRVDEMDLGGCPQGGLAQCLALIPGTSRSGATIIGGMLFGLSRPVATESRSSSRSPRSSPATGDPLWKDAKPALGLQALPASSASASSLRSSPRSRACAG